MSYQEEANWWDAHDFTEFWDELKDVEIIFELEKPKDEALTLRLQKGSKEKIAKIAKKKGISTSSLARAWLLDKLRSYPS